MNEFYAGDASLLFAPDENVSLFVDDIIVPIADAVDEHGVPLTYFDFETVNDQGEAIIGSFFTYQRRDEVEGIVDAALASGSLLELKGRCITSRSHHLGTNWVRGIVSVARSISRPKSEGNFH